MSTLLAGEVERVSGYEADPKDLRAFLNALRPGSGSLPKAKRTAPRPRVVRDDALPGVGYQIRGDITDCRTGRDVLAGVFSALAARVPSFPETFAAQVRGKKRAYLARSKAELFPGHPELEAQSVEIAPGWFLGTHSSSESKTRIIEKACTVAGLRYGTDIRVQMP